MDNTAGLPLVWEGKASLLPERNETECNGVEWIRGSKLAWVAEVAERKERRYGGSYAIA